jgi:hypothetical protein
MSMRRPFGASVVGSHFTITSGSIPNIGAVGWVARSYGEEGVGLDCVFHSMFEVI